MDIIPMNKSEKINLAKEKMSQVFHQNENFDSYIEWFVQDADRTTEEAKRFKEINKLLSEGKITPLEAESLLYI